jgi:hypothetical protein
MGAPFRTRLKNSGGLAFPKLSELPHFVCELSTVRETVGREIQATAKDTALIVLERARLIDIAHYWAASTHTRYQQRLRHARKFKANFGVKVLYPPPLPRPPTSPDVPAMWLQQQYALRRGSARGGEPNLSSVSWSTVRGICSAISQYYSWGLFMGNSTKAIKDHAARPILVEGCLPTDSLGYTFMSLGMCQRLGNSSRPSTVLLSRHIHAMNKHFNQLYWEATSNRQQREICRAALVNLAAWLGWLRAGETFSLRWESVTMTEPRDGPTLGLRRIRVPLGYVSWNRQNRTAPERRTSCSRTRPPQDCRSVCGTTACAGLVAVAHLRQNMFSNMRKGQFGRCITSGQPTCTLFYTCYA